LTLLRAGEISNDSVSGPIGWIDDGLPFDATVEQLCAMLQADDADDDDDVNASVSSREAMEQ
jgi:hypothetical protein